MKMQNHWWYLFKKGLLIQSLFLLISGFFYFFNYSELSDDEILFFAGYILILLIIFFIPTIYVHFSYYFVSRNLVLENHGIRQNGHFYLYENVRQFWIYKPNYYTGRYSSFSDYFFVKLILKDRTEISVTSLISDDIDTYFLSKIKNAEVFREDSTFSNFPKW